MKENKVQKKVTSGFTLVELIIVIVILGILAVVAAPRFIDVTDDANLSTVKAISANLQKSVKDANLRWQMSGSPGRIQNLSDFSDGTLDMSTNGWPVGLDKGNGTDNVGQGDAGCHALWNYLLVSAPQANLDTSQPFQSYRHSDSKSCSFVYRKNGDTATRTAAELGVLYNSVTGSVTTCGSLTSTAC